MMRRVLASPWIAGALAIVVVVTHVLWYRAGVVVGDEVVSGFGATLVALGILVTGQPFLRAGVRSFAEQAVSGTAPQVMGYGGPPPEAYTAHEARIVAAMPDVWSERVFGVIVIIAGTLLNGYGPLIARLLRLRTG